MVENQNIEYKENWNDDHLKWIVCFANSEGGILYIGKDDNGNVVDLKEHRRLLEDLPNKIRDILGITVEVNHHEVDDKNLLEIIVPPYSVPISLRGVFYVRSGSTKQELKGNALNEFLLRRTGKSWDETVEPSATFDDIDGFSVESFIKDTIRSSRLPDFDGLEFPDLFEKLRLTEKDRLKRASIVMFGKNPGRFFPNSFVKIGRFGRTDDELLFQETIEGNLMTLLKEVPEILNRKFLVNPIDFEGLQRIEKGEYPVAALREMILNALVHRDYMGGMTQIRVYDDRMSVWNEGSLPQGLTLDSLRRQHPSRPRNPLIADVCFKCGYIDAWGLGTLKIIRSCKDAGLPEPDLEESDGGFLVTLFKDSLTEERLRRIGLNERQIYAVMQMKQKGLFSNSDYQSMTGVSKATATRDLSDLEGKGIIENKGTKGSSAKYVLKG